MSYRRYKILTKIFVPILLLLTVISCEKEVFTGIDEITITEYGKVFVSSNPKGYKLYADDKYMNVSTPDSIYLPEGTHKLTLKHPVYLDTTLTAVVSKNAPVSLNLDLTKSSKFYAKVSCSTYPSGAKIYLNDVYTNLLTPATITKIYPGLTKIKFSKSQCRDDSTSLSLIGNQSTDVYIQLNDTTRAVDYRPVNTSPISNLFTKVVVDKFNNIWAGSLDYGLFKFDGKKWYQIKEATTSNHVTALLYDSRGRLWVGTSIGLSVFDGISWTTYTSQLPSAIVSAIKEDLTGNIWIGTVGGLAKYNNSTFQKITKSGSGLPDENVTSIAFSKTNELWIGTVTMGVIRYTDNAWMIQSAARDYLVGGDVARLVIDLAFDNNENLWAFMLGNPKEGTRNAVIKRTGTTWNEFALPTQFPVTINSFNFDSGNILWVSAVEGLVKYTLSSTAKIFNTVDYNFYAKNCTSSALDKNGNLWITTFGGGIIKLKKSSL